MKIDADKLHYRELNDRIHAALADGDKDITLDNVRGQRYIGAGLNSGARIVIHGVPGNDLGSFMNGAEITVHGNGQEGVGNTMNEGKIVIHGSAGDIMGHSMRGGRIFLRGRVGYRTGIHMKAYGDRFPVVVIGGNAMDYLGEYMAGGILVVLNLESPGASPVREYVGTGMHGGVIYLRGKIEPHQLGREVGVSPLGDYDWKVLHGVLSEYCADFALHIEDFAAADFVRLTPQSARPYGHLYAY